MPQANIYFSDEEDKIIRESAISWNLSKNDTVKRIVRYFKVEEMRKGDGL